MNSLEDVLESQTNRHTELVDPKVEAEMWNVLVQVLLPIVLVLTFVIVTSIDAYRSAYGGMKRMIDKSENEARIEVQEQKIELQLMKLLRALEIVKAGQRTKLGVVRFNDATDIRLNGLAVADTGFKELCHMARATLDGPVSEYASELYRMMLDEAKVHDPGGFSVFRWKKAEGSVDDLLRVGEVSNAEISTLVPENRKRVHNLILDFIAALQDEVTALQVGLVKEFFQQLLATGNTEDLNESALQLVNIFRNPTSTEAQRRQAAETLYRELPRRWKGRLEVDGYEFLAQSWQRLGI